MYKVLTVSQVARSSRAREDQVSRYNFAVFLNRVHYLLEGTYATDPEYLINEYAPSVQGKLREVEKLICKSWPIPDIGENVKNWQNILRHKEVEISFPWFKIYGDVIIFGRPDIVTENEVFELKFFPNRKYNREHARQTCLYADIFDRTGILWYPTGTTKFPPSKARKLIQPWINRLLKNVHQ